MTALPSGIEGLGVLVCGYTEARRKRHPVVILNAYFDDSGSEPTAPVFVLAGYISTFEKWCRFTEEWEAECNEEPAVPDFKTARAFRYRTNFGEDRLVRLAEIVRRNTVHRVSAAMRWEDVKTLLPALPGHFSRPYFYLFYKVLIASARWQRMTGFNDKISVVFDEQGTVGHEASEAYWHLMEVGPQITDLLSHSPLFQHDNVALPLKAADMLAWATRRFIERPQEHLPFRDSLLSVGGSEDFIDETQVRDIRDRFLSGTAGLLF